MSFDPDQYLGKSNREEEETPGFDPDAYLTGTERTQEYVPTGTDVTAAVGPAVTGAGFAQPTGINPQAVKQALSPVIEAVPKTVGTYINRPIAGVADIAAVAMGFPPPVAAYQGGKGLLNVPGAISATASEIGKMTSQSPLTTSPITGADYPSSVPSYREIQRAVGPEAAQKMSEAYARGGNNAVLRYLDSAPEVKSMMSNADFARMYETYRSAVPSVGQQVSKVAVPALRGAARVLGPAAMGYDLYQAGQLARETQLGERLASGQGQQAQQAFRSMNTPYGGDFINSMTPDQAQNILQSGSERDIAAFGGRDRLTEMIRKKAAEKVLGPVVPPGM